MRAVVQRVAQASVTGGGETAEIRSGLCVLVGIAASDTKAEAQDIIRQLLHLKIFPGDDPEKERWTRTVRDIRGDVLLVPQFTLFARLKSGRPSFHLAMPPATANEFFREFVSDFKVAYGEGTVGSGVFGSRMQVSLVNDGPVTIILDTA
jgi:D-aminoacyl-tRNA deacylase